MRKGLLCGYQKRKTKEHAMSKLAGWVAFYGYKHLEILVSEARDIGHAKEIALKHFKVPKSKRGLLAIEPGYDD